MMDDDKLNVLKTEVISILASCNSPLTVPKFLREYKDVIGRNFPWAQYGFRNPTEFLKSMSDVLSFKNNESGEILVPIENNSGHITKLVREQKKNPKKSSSMRRPRPFQLPRDSQKSDFKSVMQREVPNPLAVRGWERCKPIPSLLNAPTYNPVAPNISYASSHYSQFSHNLCKIDDQILQSLVLNTNSTLQTEFTSTKLPLISKKLSKNEMQNSSELIITGSYLDGADQSSILGITNGTKDEIRREDTSAEDELKNNSSPENQNIVEGDSNSKVLSSEMSSSLDDLSVEDSCPIGEKMKENFRKILSKNKGGLLVSKLASAYFKMFNVSLNCQDFGFPTIKDLVMSCHDVFKVQQKKHAKDWLLFDVNNESDDSIRWIPTQVLENMQELSLAYPKGISSNDILKIYKNMFRADLDIAKLGFDSLTSFLVNCQSIECCTDDDQYVVLPVKWGQKDEEPEESMTDPFLSVDTNSIFSKKYFQDNVCGYQFHYKKFTMPKETTIKVLVADCISPDCLWLQTLSSAASLNDLMYELNNFYDEEEHYYVMDEDVICPGLACCVKFNNKQWHRALIEEVYKNSVKVSYVDYGTSSEVSFSNLRTLNKKFSEASIHSFKSRIHNVKPLNDKSWTEECLEFFYDTILDYILVAEIVDIKAEIASVILVDTKDSEDRVINFMLVENGFALHLMDPCSTNISESNCLNNTEGETRNNTLMKTENTFPDCFLNLLPYWLHCGQSWSDVTNIFEQASNEFFNESNNEILTGVSNYLTSTECIQNRILSLFMKQPKVVCDAWNKTFYSLKDEFEKKFLESIENEFLKCSNPIGNGSTNINHNISNIEESPNLKQYSNKLKISHSKKFDESVSFKCTETNVNGPNVNTDQYSSPYRMPDLKKEDYLNKNCNSNSSHEDLATPMNISKESKAPKVIPANMFNLVIHLIRFDSEIYISIDELLLKFAKSVPSMLVKHRLCQHQIHLTPFIVTTKHKYLYDELKRQRIILKDDVFSLVPLSLCSGIILAVEPRNTRVAKVLRELSEECYASEEFWTA